ncbi:hypothetical protein TVAG_149520 [Trichomonas vaginalis G3]|uniref:Uncharacterized protein n=1 Tax=Trichomonas vaginalis (strain ATCC PRA-98 / G3) TaxID=412133 RepID=A2ELL9_TRIV3|nr:RNA polymerase II transcriptional preinitiation complex assembly [Trichomonas vaginalis G3]EAY06466.1 hypothetical protein TVAG_149520 [Trichomonas vaginalis G3]KAI5548006.1 RNA polymerase II transcriptional preinitiation complex assembly [Trichomonas vaginalis G3]|eukprot:XP_001318689.1 hypothetical protein [Trichomonas vaginalis G3]
MTQQPANILELMKQLLASMDINDYDPAVPHMLVELFYRHVGDVLKQARISSQKRGKGSEIDEDDLKRGISMTLSQSLYQQPSLATLQSNAAKINSQKMPPIPDVPEVVLPPEGVSLLNENYQVGVPK